MTVSIEQLKAFLFTGSTDSYIAHRPSVVASLLEQQQPPRVLNDVIVADMSSESPQFRMAIYPQSFAQFERLGYAISLTDDILHVLFGEQEAAVLHFSIMPQVRGERVAYALYALFKTSFPPHYPHEDPNPVGGSSASTPATAVERRETPVESWAVGLARPTPGRSKIFPLPPRQAGVEPSERMRLTVTRETPGSTGYPSMFSLHLEVLGPEVVRTALLEDSARVGGNESGEGDLGEQAQTQEGPPSVGKRAVKHLRSKIFGRS